MSTDGSVKCLKNRCFCSHSHSNSGIGTVTIELIVCGIHLLGWSLTALMETVRCFSGARHYQQSRRTKSNRKCDTVDENHFRNDDDDDITLFRSTARGLLFHGTHSHTPHTQCAVYSHWIHKLRMVVVVMQYRVHKQQQWHEAFFLSTSFYAETKVSLYSAYKTFVWNKWRF